MLQDNAKQNSGVTSRFVDSFCSADLRPAKQKCCHAEFGNIHARTQEIRETLQVHARQTYTDTHKTTGEKFRDTEWKTIGDFSRNEMWVVKGQVWVVGNKV